jgi:hypothetical protein
LEAFFGAAAVFEDTGGLKKLRCIGLTDSKMSFECTGTEFYQQNELKRKWILLPRASENNPALIETLILVL